MNGFETCLFLLIQTKHTLVESNADHDHDRKPDNRVDPGILLDKFNHHTLFQKWKLAHKE
jgi:hypothetical protein